MLIEEIIKSKNVTLDTDDFENMVEAVQPIQDFLSSAIESARQSYWKRDLKLHQLRDIDCVINNTSEILEEFRKQRNELFAKILSDNLPR
jgi:hypothetical protein